MLTCDFFILNFNGFARFDAICCFALDKPDVDSRRIMYQSSVNGHPECLIRLDVIVYLNICSVPNVLTATDIFGELLNNVPVISVIKFIAVTPNVEQPVI